MYSETIFCVLRGQVMRYDLDLSIKDLDNIKIMAPHIQEYLYDECVRRYNSTSLRGVLRSVDSRKPKPSGRNSTIDIFNSLNMLNALLNNSVFKIAADMGIDISYKDPNTTTIKVMTHISIYGCNADGDVIHDRFELDKNDDLAATFESWIDSEYVHNNNYVNSVIRNAETLIEIIESDSLSSFLELISHEINSEFKDFIVSEYVNIVNHYNSYKNMLKKLK